MESCLQQIDFGRDVSIQLRLPADTLVAESAASRTGSLDDTTAAVAAALSDPIDYPPLPQAIVPGDRIVLAVGGNVPQAAAIVAGVVQTLVEAQVDPRSITVVQSTVGDHSRPGDVASRVRDEHRDVVRAVAHDPGDRTMLTYVAASREGKPIYLNRYVGDADVLIPIGCLHAEESLGYLGIAGGLFPAFADEETQRRFQAPTGAQSSVQLKRRREEATEALWLQGSRFTLQAIPGPGDDVLSVMAGDVDSVRRKGQALASDAWRCTVPRRASLVIAAIDGGQHQQTWANVARSLFAALRIVEDDGAVVLCSDLRAAPGPSLARVARAESLDDAERLIHRDRTPDALAASLLVQSMRRVKVYMRSRLAAEVVEDLGIGHIGAPEEIARLARRHGSCILLASAQHVVPTRQEELVRS